MKYFLNILILLFVVNISIAQTFTDTIYQKLERGTDIYKIVSNGMRFFCSPKDTLPFTGILILTRNEIKRNETPCFNGLPHGKAKWWYLNDTKKEIITTWQNGVEEGKYIEWHKNG